MKATATTKPASTASLHTDELKDFVCYPPMRFAMSTELGTWASEEKMANDNTTSVFRNLTKKIFSYSGVVLITDTTEPGHSVCL